MTDPVIKLKEAVMTRRPVVLKGMSPKLGIDRCACFWYVLKDAYYDQVKVTNEPDGSTTEHWAYRERR